MKGVDKKLRKRTAVERGISENKLDFIFELYNRDPRMVTEEHKKALMDYGYLATDSVQFEDYTEEQRKEFPIDVNTRQDFNFGRVPGEYRHSGREVTADMWKPESLINHSDEFFHWINSMMYDGFQNKLQYEPLEIYIEQAHNWLSEDDDLSNYYSEDDKLMYIEQEFNRCRSNSLYFLDKYLKLYESDMLDAQSRKYIAKPAHEVMAFLFDCGYNMIMGKPRQVAATTTFQGLSLCRMIFNKNTFVKFITMDVDSAEEILEQKLKFPVSELPDWFRPSVSSDSAKGIRFGRKIKGKKGKIGGVNSRFNVVAPSISAINGGAPSLVLVDEAAYIKMLIKMLLEARPTMFRQDPSSGEIKMLRQVVVFGTGGVDEKGTKAKAYEELFLDTIDKWKNKEFDFGIVPVFFDWTTRPGMSHAFYEKEKRAYTTTGPDAEERMNQFRLTYPSRIEDMFLDSSKTLIPISYIEEREKAYTNIPHVARCQYGFFEPKFDLSQPLDDTSDVPYKIIGAEWIPCDDEYDKRVSACIFLHPEANWRDRYYMGTDPISQDNGYSNMASAVFDAKNNTIAAIVNYRDNDHKVTFLQNFLLGMYYGRDGRSCPNVIEANMGTNYTNYIEHKGQYDSVVGAKEVPPILQGGQNKFGVDNRGNRNKVIIGRLQDLVQSFGDRIYIPDIWRQLRTFTCTFTESGKETWGTSDYRKYHDDVLFACAFAYICRESYDYLNPFDANVEGGGYRTESRYVRNSDGTLSVQRKKIRL